MILTVMSRLFTRLIVDIQLKKLDRFILFCKSMSKLRLQCLKTRRPFKVSYVDYFEDKTVMGYPLKISAELLLRQITMSVLSLRSVVLEMI